MTYLDGRLKLHINKAENLPDTDTVFFNVFGGDLTDPFVVGELGDVEIFRTRYINNTLHPEWKEKFNIEVNQSADNMIINVRDKEKIGSSHVSFVQFPCDELIKGEKIKGWFNLKDSNGDRGRINMSIHFFPRLKDIQFEGVREDK